MHTVVNRFSPLKGKIQRIVAQIPAVLQPWQQAFSLAYLKLHGLEDHPGQFYKRPRK